MPEILLELHREFTDKEKLNWLLSDYKLLEQQSKDLLRQNQSLTDKNKFLSKRVKEDEEAFPSELNGIEFIKVKTYLKFRKQYKTMVDRFWEVNDELQKLKLTLKEEKL